VAVVVLALLGADKPPPPSFLAVVGLAVVLSLLIVFALPRWRATKALPKCGSFWSPGVQGAVVGLGFWLVAMMLPFSGEPSVTPGLVDYLIAAALAASMGAAGAAVLSRIA
jgi:hypothetical protein